MDTFKYLMCTTKDHGYILKEEKKYDTSVWNGHYSAKQAQASQSQKLQAANSEGRGQRSKAAGGQRCQGVTLKITLWFLRHVSSELATPKP